MQLCLGPEYFVFRLLSKYIRTKIYRIISLNIVLYVPSDHKSQLLQLHNHIAPIQQFTSCCVRNINSFTVDGLQSELNTEMWEGIFGGFDSNVTVRDFLNLYNIINACFTESKLNSTHRYNLWIAGEIKVSCRNKSIS